MRNSPAAGATASGAGPSGDSPASAARSATPTEALRCSRTLPVDSPPIRAVGCPPMGRQRTDVLYGTLALMILKTLGSMGPLHGYGLARRIEQISNNQLELNQGTLYPALLKLQQLGWITGKWGTSDTGRRARFYSITRAGRK